MNTYSIPLIDTNKLLSLTHLYHACRYYIDYAPIGIDKILLLDSYEPIHPEDIIDALPSSPALQEHFMATHTLIATMIDCNTQLTNLLFPFAKYIITNEFSSYKNSYSEFYTYISIAIAKSIRKYNATKTDIRDFLYEAIRNEFQEYITELEIPIDQNNN